MNRADGFSDLAFFATVMRCGSLAAAAQEMGVTAPSVSKRLAAVEERLGVRLLQRTTRRMSLTPEGERYWVDGAAVLAELESLERSIAGSKATPQGLLRVSATLGFGRKYIAPAIARFAQAQPAVEVQLHLTDKPVNLVEQGFDLGIRFGELPDARITARLLAFNERLLCAAPGYLKREGTPLNPRELVTHRCIFIRESDETFGTWNLHNGARHESVKVRGSLSTNDGESALGWAIEGHGILMRSQWDAAAALKAGQLVPVIPDWKLPPANIYVVFPTRDHLSAKSRALIDFLLEEFASHRGEGLPTTGTW